jgi:dihydropteroate synthase
MMEAQIQWNVTGGRAIGPAPFLVAGILNTTPDSFYDGGRHNACEQAVAWGEQLIADGASMIDIGGESTRPGADPVSTQEEIRRVRPVIESLSERIPVSVDTYRAQTAAAALEAGAAIVNDVSACRLDPHLRDVLVQYKPGYVLMHSVKDPKTMQHDPNYTDVIGQIYGFLESSMNELVRAGLPEDRIVLDPGIGFGKSLEHNLAIFRNIERFADLGRPVYMGLSNKSWMDGLLGLKVKERGTATQVATALLATRGVRIHRVHDVRRTVRTLRLVTAMAPPKDTAVPLP